MATVSHIGVLLPLWRTDTRITRASGLTHLGSNLIHQPSGKWRAITGYNDSLLINTICGNRKYEAQQKLHQITKLTRKRKHMYNTYRFVPNNAGACQRHVTADTLRFLQMLTCICKRSKAWLASRVSHRQARMRVTSASSHALPCSGEALKSSVCYACGRASPLSARSRSMP